MTETNAGPMTRLLAMGTAGVGGVMVLSMIHTGAHRAFVLEHLLQMGLDDGRIMWETRELLIKPRGVNVHCIGMVETTGRNRGRIQGRRTGCSCQQVLKIVYKGVDLLAVHDKFSGIGRQQREVRKTSEEVLAKALLHPDEEICVTVPSLRGLLFPIRQERGK